MKDAEEYKIIQISFVGEIYYFCLMQMLFVSKEGQYSQTGSH